jgi:tetratricopeptide (TPR) repeat protein
MAMQGTLLAFGGNIREAFEITSQALLRDPLNSNTRASLADRHRDLGNADKGLAVLDVGLEIQPDDIPLQMHRAYFLEEIGDFGAALQALDRVFESDAEIPNAHQILFYITFNAGDLESARTILERAEALSEERLADERALYCYVQGDSECWHAATALMLATRDRFFVQTWQSRMLHEGGLTDEAIAVLLPVVEYFDETNDSYGNLETRANLAALYQLNGDAELSAAALRPVIDAFEHSLANGYEHHELYRYRAAAAVVQGNVDEAIRLLEEAMARGFRHPNDIYYLLAFDQLRDEPRYQALLERIYRENAEQLGGV